MKQSSLDVVRRAPIVVITGGKGGVGKTMLAVNAALALARRGRRTLLVDLDLGLADVGVLLGRAPAHTLEDVLLSGLDPREAIVTMEANLDVLCGSSGTTRMAELAPFERARLVGTLKQLAVHYDLVLCDGAAGIGADALSFCAVADHVVLVTTPDPAALTDAYGLMKALDSFGEQTGREIPTPEVIVNRAASLEEADSVATKLRAVCERFLSRSPKSAGWLPASGLVELACRLQKPFAADSAGLSSTQGLLQGCLGRLASRLERLCPNRETVATCSRVSAS
jgi:flagellar biosynthesis protein FlhG